MRPYKYAICALVFGLLALSACKRHDEIQRISTYTFTNGMGVSLTMDLYPSMDDYNGCRNRISSVELAPGASKAVQLEALKTYGVDWYSADYKYSNWVEPAIRNAGPTVSTPPELEVAMADDRRMLMIDRPDMSRLLLLNGNGSSSTWKAVVNAPAALPGTHIFRLGKDFNWVDSIFNGGNVETRSGTFASHLGDYPDFYVTLFDGEGLNFAQLLYGSWAGTTGRDTLMVEFNEPGVTSFVVAVRQ
jgi:hypothetical protein